MIVVIGEILFDVFPQYRRLGGAPFNFAFHLKKLGFDVRFISRIGKDTEGKEVLDMLKIHQFNLNDIQIDDLHPTGLVNVRLDANGTPEFDIIPNVAYDYFEFRPELHLKAIRNAKLIYYGSLIQRSKAGYNNLHKTIFHKSPASRCFYDINIRPGCYNDMMIEKSLFMANILKLNQEELGTLKKSMTYSGNREAFIQFLMDGYSVDIVSLTMGEKGSRLYTADGHYRTIPAGVRRVVDSVGAGDAYAAMLAAGLLKSWQPEMILKRASAFASRICEIKGAIPDSSSFYEPFKKLFKDG